MHRLCLACSPGSHLGARLRSAGGAAGHRCALPGPLRFQQRAGFAVYHTPSSSSDTQWTVEHQVKVAPSLLELKPAFDFLRADRAKEITRRQCVELCPRLLPDTAKRVFSAFGKKSNDTLSYDELCAFIMIAGDGGTGKDKLEGLFPLCDADGDLIISVSELMAIVKLIYDARFNDSEYIDFKAAKLLEEVAAEFEGETVSIRQFTEWVRSDKPRVGSLRDLLSRPFGTVIENGGSKTWSIRAQTEVEKIKVMNPVVELDGDEMTRLVWQMIKEKLIFPFLDMDIDYYDLSITYRDETEDQVTTAAAKAIQRHNVGLKCGTIMPDAKRTLEFGLHNGHSLTNPVGALRSALDGTVFRFPIIIRNIQSSVPGWEKPIVVGRYTQEKDQRAQLRSDKPGTFKLVFEPEEGDTIEVAALKSDGDGVMMSTYNTRESAENFARGCFEYALSQGMPLYFSSKSTIFTEYDGMFDEVFDSLYENNYKKAFEEAGLWYQHHLMDDMVTQVMRSKGGFVWARKSYQGNIESDFVAHGSAPLVLMNSVLVCPDGQTMLVEASHGTVTRHYRAHQRGEKTSTNPIASIFTWSRGLAHRAKLDGNEQLERFSAALEEACITCVENGHMSKDLAISVHGAHVEDDQWLLTEDLLDAIARQLRLVLLKPLRSVDMVQDEPFVDAARNAAEKKTDAASDGDQA